MNRLEAAAAAAASGANENGKDIPRAGALAN
jgi:hypothetical protein